jgi:hypothetical protein
VKLFYFRRRSIRSPCRWKSWPSISEPTSSRPRRLKIDEDGRFLYWPHADVHLGWQQFRQIADPAAAVVARQKTAEFNRRYGAAIRLLREERALKQADISGLTARHLRSVEHGDQPASKAMLEALAKAHGMAIEDYLKELAKRVSRRSRG